MKKIKLLLKFMEGNRLLYLGAILAVGLATLFEIMIPLIMKVVIDSVIGGQPIELPPWVLRMIPMDIYKGLWMQQLWLWGAMIVVLTMANGLFLYLKGKWSAAASESVAKNMREKLYHHLQQLPYDYHIQAETGDLVQRCTSDVDTVRKFLAVQFVEIGKVLLMIIFTLGIMLSLHGPMTAVASATLPIIFLFTFVFFLKVQEAFRISDEAEGRLSTLLQENLSGMRVVKAFGRQGYEMDKFDGQNRAYRDVTYRLIQLLAYFWSLSDLICFLQIGAVLVYGTILTTKGTITLGTLVVFITYERKLVFPIRQLGRILTDLGKSLVSLERMNEVLETPIEEGLEEGLKPEIYGKVEFHNVSFEYEEGRKVLKNISFQVEKGQTVAILGPTGSGKTSLVHLLLRLYDYQGGSVQIDGVELKDIHKRWLREKIGIVLQEPFLYSKTIKENIGLTEVSVEEEQIIEAAEKASIHDVILQFEKGYDTPVGERGITLSGGQKQRVAIARTIIRNVPILIFDDSLSAVDTETDLSIRKALKERQGEVTTFMISHRVTTLSEADLILVIEDGEIVQSGKHEDLIQEEGLYRRIWAIQNELEEELQKDMEQVAVLP